MYRPNLGDLAGKLRRQVLQMCWRLAIVCNPHQVSVDEDGEVVTIVVAGSSMADESRRYELCRGPCKAIK